MGLASEGFESVDFQLQLLFGDPISKQADDLLDALHRDDRMAEYARRLAYAYMSQDIDEMWRLFTDEEMGSDDVEMYKMIYSRNVVWVDKLQHIMPHKSVFVCVGAGHLVGGRGVLALLRNAGYVVMPVY
ncbi:MAG: TraB/GumN family protein, partial [Muribaculaceae bacterium]|nr:TraB/GumN family protein [Muribaculaceae bacterium]